jgi:hypothetical protein
MATAPFGQTSREPVLVDEYGSLPCDDLIGRLDLFFFELSNDPGSTGFVVISRPKVDKRLSVFRQHLIVEHAKYRKFDSNRIRFVRNHGSNGVQDQLWRIPAGSPEPKVDNVDMSYQLPNDIKPFILAVEYSYGDGICPELDGSIVFAEFLNGNPGSSGNIVVRERTVQRAQRQIERIRKKFRTRFGIASSRLRFFPRRASVPTNYQEPIVEYWYLP